MCVRCVALGDSQGAASEHGMLNVQPIPAFAPSGALALAVITEQLHTSCVTMHPSTLITRSTVFAELVSHCPRALHPRRLQATLLDYLQPPIEHAIVAAMGSCMAPERCIAYRLYAFLTRSIQHCGWLLLC